jgi:hypothetical protein
MQQPHAAARPRGRVSRTHPVARSRKGGSTQARAGGDAPLRRVLLLWPPVRYALGSARAARRTSPPRRWKRIGGEIPHHRSRCRVPGPRPAPAAAYCSLRVRARAHPRARPRPSRRKADAGRMGRGRAAMSGGRRRPPAGPRRGGPGHAGGTADVAATVTSIFFKINKNKSEKRMSCMRQARPSIARGQLGWGARVQRVTAAHGSRRAGLLAALRLRPRPAKQPACALLASASYYWGPDFLSAAAAAGTAARRHRDPVPNFFLARGRAHTPSLCPSLLTRRYCLV